MERIELPSAGLESAVLPLDDIHMVGHQVLRGPGGRWFPVADDGSPLYHFDQAVDLASPD